MTVCGMRNEKNIQYIRDYRNSLVIVDLAMVQILRSTERFQYKMS